MRYIPQNSPLIDKYYIYDTVEKKITTEMGFDIIVDIVADKYAIVGTKNYYSVDFRHYVTYKYILIDVNGRELFNSEFEFVYPTDSIIYCKITNLPINQLTYLGNYVWDYKGDNYLSQSPFLYFDNERAITKGEFWEDRSNTILPKFGHYYQLIDRKGHVIKEEKVARKESAIKKLYNSNGDNNHTNYIYIEILDESLDEKWSHINDITERTNNKFNNLCTIQVNDRLCLTNVHLGFAWNKYLLIYRDDNEYNRSFHNERRIINRASNCVAILSDSFKLLYYSEDGFKVNTKVFDDLIIIGEDYIMDYNGSLYNIPANIIFRDDFCDYLGYLQIEMNDKLGFINNRGKIVIPPIFPKDRQIGINEDAANDSWREYQRYAVDSVSDAFEGKTDAYLNID